MVNFRSGVWLTTACLSTAARAHYQLVKDFSGYDFVSGFDFYNGPDPTNGHVQYKGYATANATGLTGFLVGPNGTNMDNSALPPPIYLGVDYENVYPATVGRPSVRVSSVQTYNYSLILADIQHMPSSTCGLWPAYWLLGASAPWPNSGEIDILENVNDNDFNMVTIHTGAGLSIVNDTSLFNGTMKTSNCDVNAPNQDKNAGCTIFDSPAARSYGTNFNEGGGGVFAMQYVAEYIAIWFFPQAAVPADIKSNSPIPPSGSNQNSSWGKPMALFKPADFAASSNSTPASAPLAVSATSPSAAASAPLSASATAATAVAAVVSTPVSAPASALAYTTPLSDASASAMNSTKAPASISITPETDPPSASSDNNNSTQPSTLLTHILSLQILFDTTFCGDWAGKVWNASATCSKLAPTCEEYVSQNPDAFKDAFWAIRSVKVFEDD